MKSPHYGDFFYDFLLDNCPDKDKTLLGNQWKNDGVDYRTCVPCNVFIAILGTGSRT